MDIESDPIRIAQSALLLTYYATSSNRFRVNSQWLSTAIRFAHISHADRFYDVGPNDPKKRKALKRLWWGCVCRDRVLPLGLRRPIQIQDCVAMSFEDRFLQESDFDDELGMSRVHDEEAQRANFRVINLTCKLAEALTPALVTL